MEDNCNHLIVYKSDSSTVNTKKISLSFKTMAQLWRNTTFLHNPLTNLANFCMISELNLHNKASLLPHPMTSGVQPNQIKNLAPTPIIPSIAQKTVDNAEWKKNPGSS